jgi:hypothetical protein
VEYTEVGGYKMGYRMRSVQVNANEGDGWKENGCYEVEETFYKGPVALKCHRLHHLNPALVNGKSAENPELEKFPRQRRLRNSRRECVFSFG